MNQEATLEKLRDPFKDFLIKQDIPKVFIFFFPLNFDFTEFFSLVIFIIKILSKKQYNLHSLLSSV